MIDYIISVVVEESLKCSVFIKNISNFLQKIPFGKFKPSVCNDIIIRVVTSKWTHLLLGLFFINFLLLCI